MWSNVLLFFLKISTSLFLKRLDQHIYCADSDFCFQTFKSRKIRIVHRDERDGNRARPICSLPSKTYTRFVFGPFNYPPINVSAYYFTSNRIQSVAFAVAPSIGTGDPSFLQDTLIEMKKKSVVYKKLNSD